MSCVSNARGQDGSCPEIRRGEEVRAVGASYLYQRTLGRGTLVGGEGMLYWSPHVGYDSCPQGCGLLQERLLTVWDRTPTRLAR